MAIAQSLDLTGLAQEKIATLQEAMDTDYASLDAERKKEAMHRLVSAIALIQVAQKNLTEPKSPYHGSKVHAGDSYYLYNVGHAGAATVIGVHKPAGTTKALKCAWWPPTAKAAIG